MSRGKRYYQPIQLEEVSTPETALANLRPQLENALHNAEYFRESDSWTAYRHASYAERLTKEIAVIEAQIVTPALDISGNCTYSNTEHTNEDGAS